MVSNDLVNANQYIRLMPESDELCDHYHQSMIESSRRLSTLVVAGFLGYRYLDQLRDSTPGYLRLPIALEVFALIGVAFSPDK